MPAVISSLQPPDSNVALQPPHPNGRLSSHIYFVALVVLAALLVLPFAAPEILNGWAWLRCKRRRNCRKDSRRDFLAPPSGFSAITAGARALAQGRKQQRQAMEKSREVSTNPVEGTSQGGPLDTSREAASSASSSSLTSHGEAAQEKSGAEDGSGRLAGRSDMGGELSTGFSSGPAVAGGAGTGTGAGAGALDFSAPMAAFMSRPPPPPPLTPPTLSAAVFTFDDRRPSHSISIPPELDTSSPMSFIHQPNPDYAAASSSANVAASSPSTPRRRSYTKTVPIGVPTAASGPQDSFAATSDAFSPSSYPSASPLLPPPPPGHHEVAYDSAEAPREIDVQGEIISVLDDSGAGWKRHTRVYGGGVCLACLAAEGGGFYGDKVPPEERR